VVSSAAQGISITCPRTHEMCDHYAVDMAPSVDVYSPIEGDEIGPNITAALRLNNFAAPGDGYVRVTLAGLEVARVGGPATPGRRHTFPLSLPEGALMLKFELVGGGESVAFTRDVNVVVKLDVNGWLQVGPARCCSPRHRMSFNSKNEGSKCVG